MLTLSSIAVSLFLVATLLTVLSAFMDPPETPDSALRLLVRHRVSLMNVLPVSHRGKIAGLEGVDAAVGGGLFRAENSSLASVKSSSSARCPGASRTSPWGIRSRSTARIGRWLGSSIRTVTPMSLKCGRGTRMWRTFGRDRPGHRSCYG